MITQFGSGGISVVLDKSAFHSFNYEEILLLHKYYWVNITPILVREVLGDLKKETEDGCLNSKKVIEFANKLHPFKSSVNTFYLKLIEAELLGLIEVPFYKPLVDTAQILQMPNGQKAARINPSDDSIAIDRWKNGEFTDAEKEVSQLWRETTLHPDVLINTKTLFDKSFPYFKGLKNQKEILDVLDSKIADPRFHIVLIENFIEEFSIPSDKAAEIFYRWETTNEKNLQKFACYTLFCFRAKFLFYISLQNDLINTYPTNWLDMQYAYYLPFCRVFLSNDKLHDKIIPFLIDKNQIYIRGTAMKQDLKKIIEIKKQLTGDSLIRVETEPPRNPDLLAYRIWKGMYVGWPPRYDFVPSEEELQMANEIISQFRNAKPVS